MAFNFGGNMKRIIVVMSTYNGADCLEKQIESIFAQKGVEVSCLVRDDGSTDNTLKVLEKCKDRFGAIEILKGENVGWRKSFLLALKNADEADYYAFSDQDDIWFEDKLIKSITELEKHNSDRPLMFHCNRVSCDENLVPIKPAPKLAKPLNKKNAIVQEFAQGCSIVMNKVAKELVTKGIPKCDVPHDMWTGMVCYYFGEVYYSSEPLFYHINHGTNASGAGHIHKSRFGRLKRLNKFGCYPNVAEDMLDIYGELLTEEDKQFLTTAVNVRNSFACRLKLIFDLEFRRKFLCGTLSLKYSVLMGKF